MIRSGCDHHLDRVTFIEFVKLPGIISDRLHLVFARSDNCDGKQILDSISEAGFVDNFVRVFTGSLETRLRLVFEMLDFDDDSFITPEDVRIVMSYVTINREVLETHFGLVRKFLPSEGMYG